MEIVVGDLAGAVMAFAVVAGCRNSLRYRHQHTRWRPRTSHGCGQRYDLVRAGLLRADRRCQHGADRLAALLAQHYCNLEYSAELQSVAEEGLFAMAMGATRVDSLRGHRPVPVDVLCAPRKNVQPGSEQLFTNGDEVGFEFFQERNDSLHMLKPLDFEFELGNNMPQSLHFVAFIVGHDYLSFSLNFRAKRHLLGSTCHSGLAYISCARAACVITGPGLTQADVCRSPVSLKEGASMQLLATLTG